ncbi:MAG: type II secretion system GspH family protein [Heliobacteriaceae bacterium]|nr:type II secretion system GspH family protein [Heliobacteriaceae bacterium]
MKKTAFTLAEVLITLGIIGVVAALTMPALITKYQKQAAVIKVKKFYSTMNQAIKLSEVENGSANEWNVPAGHASYQDTLDFYNMYLAKYIKAIKEIKPSPYDSDKLCIYMSDGTLFCMGIWAGVDVQFYTSEQCLNAYANDPSNPRFKRCSFTFGFIKTTGDTSTKYVLEPYSAGSWDGTREGLLNNAVYGCLGSTGSYCAKLIQWDGWEIKDDYPW